MRYGLKDLSLRRKVTLVVMLTTCVALVLASVAFVAYEEFVSRLWLTRELATLAQFIGDLSTAALAFDDPTVGREMLEDLSLEAFEIDQDIVSARILGRDGSVFAEYTRSGTEAPPVRRMTEEGSHFEDGHLILARKILLDGEEIGSVYIESDVRRISAQLRRYGVLVAFGVLLASSLLALLLTEKLQRLISAPILELASTARRISEGEDFSLRAPTHGSDEVGQLIETFNGMLARIEEREEQLLRDALHDGLTALPNRAMFDTHLKISLARTKRVESYGFALLFVDIDNFKIINDSFGHLRGDEALVEIANRLQRSFRVVDTVARFGGDEFTILVDGVPNVESAMRTAQRVQAEFSRPFTVGESEVFVTSSIGIAVSKAEYRNAEEVLRDANTAMYNAKSQGPGSCRIFDPAMHEHAVARLKLETDLRQACRNDEFRVHYQPIVSLADRRLSGFEALVRWQHPERGLLGPGKFLEVAHETGMIVSIDRWVLHEACRQMVQWQSQFCPEAPLRIHVNLAHSHIFQPDLLALIQEVLRETGLDADCLVLELTEDVIMDRRGILIETVSNLKALGIGVAIDDFGTGYSSLSYLRQLPIDTLKIDRSFIRAMEKDPADSEFVRAILSLGHNVGMKVIAEGIETQAQLEELTALKSDYGQGFLFSKPLPASGAQELIDAPAWLKTA